LKIEDEIQFSTGFIGNKDTIYLLFIRNVAVYFVFSGWSMKGKGKVFGDMFTWLIGDVSN